MILGCYHIENGEFEAASKRLSNSLNMLFQTSDRKHVQQRLIQEKKAFAQKCRELFEKNESLNQQCAELSQKNTE